MDNVLLKGTSSGAAKKKTTQGRKKIEIKMIESANNRQVTFSKRRAGLFKKASELCILSGSEIAIIVLSQGKRVFTFGHPTPDSVVDRFLTGSVAAEGEEAPPVNFSSAAEYNEHYSKACKELEAEKKRKAAIEEAASGGGGEGFWWDKDVEGLDLEELEEYVKAMEELIENVNKQADSMRNSMLPLPPPLPAPMTIGKTDVDAAAMVNPNQLNRGFEYEYENCAVPHGLDEGHI